MTTQAQQGRVKVVLEEMETGTAVGIQAKECDPQISVLAGVTLDGALDRVPELVAQARERWAERPQNPAYQRPPEPERPRATPQASNQAPTASRRQEPEITQTRLM